METWITSDGRAYFVQLHESESEGESSTSELVEDEQVCELSLSACIFLFIHDVCSQRPHTRPSFDDASRLHPAPPNGSNWHGTCVHDFPTPRWVQKQRRIDPSEPLHERNRRAYVEPKQAVCVALNSRFSLIAVGMLG